MTGKQDNGYLLQIACENLRKALQAKNVKRTVPIITKKGNTLYSVYRGKV